MKYSNLKINSNERGGAGAKLLIVLVVLALVGHAGINYVPVAYNAVSLKEGLDSAVVKGLSATGQLKPIDVVKASVQKALAENNAPPDAWVEIKPVSGVVQAHVIFTQPVNILPFGIYQYNYDFNYMATANGYVQ